jgi:transcriptional regulator GlxA family with amidase domain
MAASRTVAIVALPGVQLLDVSGPLDVFAEANVQSGCAFYDFLLVASGPGYIRSSCGARLVPDVVIGEAIDKTIDTLLVAGCPNAVEMQPDPATVSWLRYAAPLARRYGSVCSGAFFLAATGLLDGRRVTTHWAVAEDLARGYPAIDVERDAIHVQDGQVRTAAGVTAGLDLALALVEEDLGREVATRVARQLVMFFKRPARQARLSRNGAARPVGRSALQEAQRWAAANPAADLSVASLARRAGLSPRHFARMFHAEVGITPAAWVEAVRVAAAQRLLEAGQHTPKQVAVGCGFADANSLRRAFLRRTGVTPAEYRRGAAERADGDLAKGAVAVAQPA